MNKLKSNLERTFYRNHNLEYEPQRYKYTAVHSYCPDFKITENVFVEVKDRFVSADKSKHLYIKKQHPELTIIFVFPNPNRKCTPNMTNAEWCIKHGYTYFNLSDKEGINKCINSFIDMK